MLGQMMGQHCWRLRPSVLSWRLSRWPSVSACFR